MNNRKGKMRLRLFLICAVFVLIIIFAIFIGAQIYRSNQDSQIKKVLGIDVSAYQGDIDWKEIERQGIYFAYIKATESDTHKDAQFEANWKNIDSTSIMKGAYLYYDFGKDGNAMADFFIENVPVERRTLPPAIDIELDSETSKALPNPKSVQSNLNKVITKLRDTYHQNPVIYTNTHTYNTYFKDNPVQDVSYWICDISNNEPELQGVEWEFWQFSWRGMLNGIDSDEKFVDYDVYNGDLNDFYNQFDKPFFQNLFG